MNSGIYKIESKSTGAVYYGRAKSLDRRWMQHKLHLRASRHHSKTLQLIYDAYGLDDLLFIVCEECALDIIQEREQAYLDFAFKLPAKFRLNTAQNAGSNLGFKMSAETISKLTRIRQNISSEWRANLSSAWRRMEPEKRERIFSKLRTPEWRNIVKGRSAKMNEANRAKNAQFWRSQEGSVEMAKRGTSRGDIGNRKHSEKMKAKYALMTPEQRKAKNRRVTLSHQEHGTHVLTVSEFREKFPSYGTHVFHRASNGKNANGWTVLK